MVLNQIEWPRLITVFITQPISAIVFISLAIKILTRKRDQVSISLATFYVISSFAITFNVIFVILTLFNQNEYLLYLFYFLTAYPLIFSPFFIIIFLNLLLNIENKSG